MSHEHHGTCCGHQETLQAEIINHIGSLCMAGHCQHSEHQAGASLMHEQQLFAHLSEESSVTTAKKKKKRAARNFIDYAVLGNLPGEVA